MSTSGILRSNEIVFYHPLDDFNEHTIPQLWDGSGTFMPSKVDLGLVANSQSVIWGSPEEHGMFNVGKGSVVRLDDTRALLMGVSGNFTTVQVATVSGTTTTFGPVYNAGSNSLSSSEPLGALFSSGVVVLQWRHQGYIRLKVATVSGDVVSLGSELTMIFTVPVGNIVSLTPTLGIITYRHESPDDHTRARVIEISGTTITLGDAIQLSSIDGGACGSSLARLNDYQAIVVYSNASVETLTSVLTVSGTNDLTVGPSSLLADYGTSNNGFSRVINLSRYEDSNDVAFVWISGGTNIMTAVGAVDGEDITIGQEQHLAGAVALMGVAELDSSSYVIAYTYSTIRRLAIIYNVSGLNIYPGIITSLTLDGSTPGGSMDSLRDDLFIVMHPNNDVVVGSIVAKADIEASDPGQYPVASGNDRVIVSMWEKNLANGISETILQRDYNIGITSGSISIGPAIWSDSGVLSFLDNISDGSRHLLVLDFEHDDSGIWTLNTSIDGANWVDRGVQTSGVQDISPTSSSPNISIEDGVTDQWIDEVAMWAGDKATFDKFTDEELVKLYELGIIFDAPLPRYDSTTWLPLYLKTVEPCSGSGNLFINGSETTSASSDLFISGPGLATASITMRVVGFFHNDKLFDADNVIFYHPLDSYVDGVQGDEWEGYVQFTDAVFSSGIGSVNLSEPVASSGEFILTDNEGVWLTPIPGDDSKALFLDLARGRVKARVISVSGDNVIVGPDDFSSFSSCPRNRGDHHVVHVSGDLYVSAWCNKNQTWLTAVSMNVSGDTVTFNTSDNILVSGTNAIDENVSVDRIPGAPSGGFLLAYSDIVTHPFGNNSSFLTYGQINDSGDVSIGSPLVFPSGVNSTAIVLSSDKAVVLYRDVEDNVSAVRVVDIDGTTLSVGPRIIIGITTGRVESITKLHSSGFLVIRRGSGSMIITSYSVSGTMVNAESSGVTSASVSTLWNPAIVYDTDQSRGFYNYLIQTGTAIAGHFTIDEDYNMSIGSNIVYETTSGFSSAIDAAATLIGDDRFLVYNNHVSTMLMKIVGNISGILYSQQPDIYPSAIGASGLTLAYWIEMHNASNTVVSAGRDCKIDIADEYISLGDGTAYWKGSGIIDLMTSIGDGEPHSLLIDFRYQGSNNWKLNTSVDGNNWTDHGVQTSGSQGLMTTPSTPTISFNDESVDQKLDEVVLWKDADQFTPIELVKLFTLGDTYNLPMGAYGDTEILVPSSGISTLFMRGVGSGDLAKSMDWLIKTHDYYPQIIGTLEGAASVNIQLWDITDGQNTLISVASSGCYEIGSTGRWGWSTTHLPPDQGNARHYFYMMTSNVSETFDGQFVLDVPEKAKWIYPNNQDEYIQRM